jgi:hypothetical protein
MYLSAAPSVEITTYTLKEREREKGRTKRYVK